MTKRAPATSASPATLIDARIASYDDWRGPTLARLRALIIRADPAIVEEWRWNVPVWSRDGIICTGEVYKSVVKLTFARGASLPDPAGLFNSSLDGNTRRAIDVRDGEAVDTKALTALVRAAAAFNRADAPAPRGVMKAAKVAKAPKAAKPTKARKAGKARRTARAAATTAGKGRRA